MKIVEINSVTYGSTGKIMLEIADEARNNDMLVYTFAQNGKSQRKDLYNHFSIGFRIEKVISIFLNYLFSSHGCFNYLGTMVLLKRLKEIKPDIIHIHNAHGNYVNLVMLLKFIKRHRIPVVWTLHDCWTFTGHCPYFDMAKCEKWKVLCDDCPKIHDYPSTLFDRSKREFLKKKKYISALDQLMIITPSKWLCKLVKQSFLSGFKCGVINNGIDLQVFRYRESDFRERYGLQDKFIILGIAFSWDKRKGLDRIEDIANRIDDRFRIVVVGLKKNSNSKIVYIEKTSNQKELAEIYSSADILFNPTREENFPTVNIEALACGTPVMSFGAGGSAEAFDENTGIVVDQDNVIMTLEQLYHNNFSRKACEIKGQEFNKKDKYLQYIRLFNSIYEHKEYD